MFYIFYICTRVGPLNIYNIQFIEFVQYTEFRHIALTALQRCQRYAWWDVDQYISGKSERKLVEGQDRKQLRERLVQVPTPTSDFGLYIIEYIGKSIYYFIFIYSYIYIFI